MEKQLQELGEQIESEIMKVGNLVGKGVIVSKNEMEN